MALEPWYKRLCVIVFTVKDAKRGRAINGDAEIVGEHLTDILGKDITQHLTIAPL